MKMKEDSWSLGKLDNEAYNRHVEQEESKDKQRRHSGQDKPSARVEDHKQRHQEKRPKYHEPAELQQERKQEQNTHLRRSPLLPLKSDPQLDGRSSTQPVDQATAERCCTNENEQDDDDDDYDKRVEDAKDVNDDDDDDDIKALKTLEERLLQASGQANGAGGGQQASAQADSQTHVRAKQSKREDNEVNLSFCGCGFLGIYHVGVASCFHEYAPQLSMHKISGSSAGALVAMAHICGNLQLAYCTTDILAVAIEARSHTLGPFHPSFDIQASVREALERGLPEDAWEKATGKLHVSLTRVEDGENVIINEFQSNEDLIQVLLCSCFIPFWSGIRLPRHKGVAYIDGGFSDNLLILDDKTVTVSPFAGEADICPQDDTLNLLQINLSNTSFSISPSNLYRLSHALLPPEPEVLSDLCKQGFADGIRYLQRMNLISCTKCLEIRSSLLVTTDGEDIEEVLSINSHAASGDSFAADFGLALSPLGSLQANGAGLAETAAPFQHRPPPAGRAGDNLPFQQIILEQQEQKMVEISEGVGHRSSFVSVSGANHSAQQQQQQQSCSALTPSISLRNLLSGKMHDEEANKREATAPKATNINNINHSGNDSGETQQQQQQQQQQHDDGAGQEDAHCNECTLIRQKALYDPLPKQFSDRIRAACDKVNKSLSNWIYSHRPVKYLSYLMVPYYLPIDLTIALVYKCWKKLPWIRTEMTDFVSYMLEALIVFLRRMQSRSTSAMLMGFGASWEEDVIAYEKELMRQQQQQQEKTRVHHHHYHHHHHHHSGGGGGGGISLAGQAGGGLGNSLGSTGSLQSACAADSVSLSSARQRAGSNLSLASVGHHHASSASPATTSGAHPRELHSLEDTFDSIVDVTSEQEGRIFAYYFRDSKDRLRVTEIFELERQSGHHNGAAAPTSAPASGHSQQAAVATAAAAAAANQSSREQKTHRVFASARR